MRETDLRIEGQISFFAVDGFPDDRTIRETVRAVDVSIFDFVSRVTLWPVNGVILNFESGISGRSEDQTVLDPEASVSRHGEDTTQQYPPGATDYGLEFPQSWQG